MKLLSIFVIMVSPLAISCQLAAQEADQADRPEPIEQVTNVEPRVPVNTPVTYAPPPLMLDARSNPVPRGSPSRWIGPIDYPLHAVRAEIDGRVSVRLAVGANGRVSNCKISRSAGDPLLDEATCKLLQRRARFRPARDRLGKLTEGTWMTTVRWQIPEIRPGNMKVSAMVFSYLVDTDGTVSKCRVDRKSGDARSKKPCRDVPAKVEPIRIDGELAKVRVRYTRNVTHEPIQ